MDFCHLLKSWAKILVKTCGKCSQKLLDSAKKSTTDVIKSASKRVIQKTAEGTGDLIGNKSADKIINTSKNIHKMLWRQMKMK